jgi:NAD(P)-dependent dehydrogenase (short-subunit alcohol dehydrogenase family)
MGEAERIFRLTSIVLTSRGRIDMSTLSGKTAIVVGASSGVGRATAKALVSEGVTVVAVARGADGLASVRAELGKGVRPVRADAADPATADRLLRDHRPDYIVLAGGVVPETAPVDALSWESFSAPWNADVQLAFHFMKAAVTLPLAIGSCVVVVSSGAAINGSSLSGGYAGAKRMQWLLAGYMQQIANTRQLGLRFLAVVPKQLIEGTEIGAKASAAYGASLGISSAEFMKRFDIPLDSDKVAAAIVRGLRGEVGEGATAIAVTGKGVEPLG